MEIFKKPEALICHGFCVTQSITCRGRRRKRDSGCHLVVHGGPSIKFKFLGTVTEETGQKKPGKKRFIYTTGNQITRFNSLLAGKLVSVENSATISRSEWRTNKGIR